jgi:hypothetical protein
MPWSPPPWPPPHQRPQRRATTEAPTAGHAPSVRR